MLSAKVSGRLKPGYRKRLKPLPRWSTTEERREARCSRPKPSGFCVSSKTCAGVKHGICSIRLAPFGNYGRCVKGKGNIRPGCFSPKMAATAAMLKTRMKWALPRTHLLPTKLGVDGNNRSQRNPQLERILERAILLPLKSAKTTHWT